MKQESALRILPVFLRQTGGKSMVFMMKMCYNCVDQFAPFRLQITEGETNILRLLLLLVFLLPGSPAAEDMKNIGKFSSFSSTQELFESWEPLTFEKIDTHTRYSLVKENGRNVVRAESTASASGLIRKVRIDLSEYPVIEWSWKITRTYENGDVLVKSGDDYPARIYITFAYDPDRVSFLEKVKFNAIKAVHGEYPPVAAINYIWASKAEKGTMVSNPYTDRVKMIVVRSGNTMADRWVKEKRNIFEDYKTAFNGRNPPPVSGIAVMTDSDNTGESGLSFYGDIRLKNPEK